MVARLVYLSHSLAVAATSSAMALMVSYIFRSRAFSKRYIPPADDRCVSFQLQFSLAKKGLKF